MDETIKITLPVIIGLCITAPLYIIGGLTNYFYLVLSSLPMMGGVVASMIITFKSLRKDKVSLIPDKMAMIGICIGATPLIIFMVYFMVNI